MTFLAALRCDRITAPCVVDGPINGESFRAYIEQFLLLTLRPGEIVIMDNLGSHKGSAIRRRIRTAGARLFFLPQYSPDLNPIEPAFAKLKVLPRKADERNIERVSSRIGHILDAFTPAECANYFRKQRICFDLRRKDSRPQKRLQYCNTMGLEEIVSKLLAGRVKCPTWERDNATRHELFETVR